MPINNEVDSDNMDVEVDPDCGTPDSSEVTMLQTHLKIFLQKFNSKWKIGRHWLYWSNPLDGPIARVMKYEAYKDFRLGEFVLECRVVRLGVQSFNSQQSINMRNPLITSEASRDGMQSIILRKQD